MECMYHVYEVPTPIVTYSFPFQMPALGEISLGCVKPNLEKSSVKMTKENMTRGGRVGKPFHIRFSSHCFFLRSFPLFTVEEIVEL